MSHSIPINAYYSILLFYINLTRILMLCFLILVLTHSFPSSTNICWTPNNASNTVLESSVISLLCCEVIIMNKTWSCLQRAHSLGGETDASLHNNNFGNPEKEGSPSLCHLGSQRRLLQVRGVGDISDYKHNVYKVIKAWNSRRSSQRLSYLFPHSYIMSCLVFSAGSKGQWLQRELG